MKLIHTILSLLFCLQITCGITLNFKFIDEKGDPLPDVKVEAIFDVIDTRKAGIHKKGTSNEKGEITLRGQTFFPVRVEAKKKGYYHIETKIVFQDERILNPVYVLREVRKPIPLFAYDRTAHGFSLKPPTYGDWYPFDLKINDWVAPYGLGEVGDIVLKITKENMGFKHSKTVMDKKRKSDQDLYLKKGENWDQEGFIEYYSNFMTTLDVRFMNEQEGIARVSEEDYMPYSEKEMPSLAYESGYQPALQLKASNYVSLNNKAERGYFIRSRVKTDANGNIISAHYSKIAEGFQLSYRGELTPVTYFNPTPNDRNLEFDKDKNLYTEKSHATITVLMKP